MPIYLDAFWHQISIVADDIIIAAKNNQEHDHILTQVLERAKERNIVFNLEKLQL